MAAAKTALTVAALGVTGYSRILGRKLSRSDSVPAADATTPTSATPTGIASAQKQLTLLQWAVPALTAAIWLVASYASEQYRPEEVAQGAFQRIFS